MSAPAQRGECAVGDVPYHGPKAQKKWPDEEGHRDTSITSLGSFIDRLVKVGVR